MEFERVKNVIVDQLSVDADEVTLEASFVDDLGADSLDVVELIMGLETENGCRKSSPKTSPTIV